MDKYAILHIEGGIGKNVMATAVVRAINKKHPDRKIVVVTAYPDIWMNNPRVHKIEHFGAISYFYENYVKEKGSLLFIQDPYKHPDFIYRRKHLTQIWCDMCKVDWDGYKPEIYFTQLELDFCSTMINKDSRPIFMINAFGGAIDQRHKYSWARDIPPHIAQEIVDAMSVTHRVIQIRRENQIELANAESYSTNIRQTAMMLMFSDERLLIDSFMQHVSAAFEMKSTVLWACNSPKVFGYISNNNIHAEFNPGDLKNSMYEPYDITGDPIQISTPPNVMYDKDLILGSLGYVKTRNIEEVMEGVEYLNTLTHFEQNLKEEQE